MLWWKSRRGLVALGVGLAAGLILGGFWPHTPLYAVATDRTDSVLVATGPVDSEVEALFILDSFTGELKTLVLGKQPGTFTGYFTTNVAKDLGIDPQKNPKFAMVTGVVGLRRSGGNRAQPGGSVCYVVEVTSGKLAAYAVPWSASLYSSGQPQNGQLYLVGETRFRTLDGKTPGAAAK